jgi:hypothetical protein
MPANARLFATIRTAGRAGRPTTENRGVPSSSLGLAIPRFACLGPFLADCPALGETWCSNGSLGLQAGAD